MNSPDKKPRTKLTLSPKKKQEREERLKEQSSLKLKNPYGNRTSSSTTSEKPSIQASKTVKPSTPYYPTSKKSYPKKTPYRQEEKREKKPFKYNPCSMMHIRLSITMGMEYIDFEDVKDEFTLEHPPIEQPFRFFKYRKSKVLKQKQNRRKLYAFDEKGYFHFTDDLNLREKEYNRLREERDNRIYYVHDEKEECGIRFYRTYEEAANTGKEVHRSKKKTTAVARITKKGKVVWQKTYDAYDQDKWLFPVNPHKQ
jgi:hypothetical protein|nr:MAG TPA: hypothetical protein [Caudoviricetes sp.]